MLQQLAEIVAETGRALMEWRRAGVVGGRLEGTQFKAQADQLAHDRLSGLLKKLRPDLPVLSEEDAASLRGPRPAKYWLIDPIDGTASFVGGYSGFVTQAALMRDDGPELAAVCMPATETMYTARRGEGARCNGASLSVRDTRPARILIDNYPEPRGAALEAFSQLRFSSYIECGSIGLKICRIADGTADVFYKDVIVRDWDLAAPHLILAEAGGVLTDARGGDIRYAGEFEVHGVIAARDRSTAKAMAAWHHDREGKRV